MTIPEAIEELYTTRNESHLPEEQEALDIAIQALKEIQQYKTIGIKKKLYKLAKLAKFDLFTVDEHFVLQLFDRNVNPNDIGASCIWDFNDDIKYIKNLGRLQYGIR